MGKYYVALSVVDVFGDVPVGAEVYGHFGPKTLRTQDTSAPVPKCLGHFGTIYTSYTEVSH